MGVTESNSNFSRPWLRKSRLRCVFGLLATLWIVDLQSQEIVPPDLPSTRHLAAALSDPESRADTLMTMVAVARLLEYGMAFDASQVDTLEARFRSERAWLDRLAGRYAELPMRGSLLDSAAWFLLLELDQQQLSPGPLVSPLGPSSGSLMEQLFDRTDEHLAAAFLPELLPRMELQSTFLWEALLGTAGVNENLLQLVSRLNPDWFDPWIAAEPPAPAGEEGPAAVIKESLELLEAIAATILTAGPPDALSLKRLRFNLLNALPMLGQDEAEDAEYLLMLAGAVDGLHERQYLSFTETLLWVASSLLLAQEALAVALPEEMAEMTGVERAAEFQPGLTDPAEVPEEIPDGEPEDTYNSPLPRALSDLLPMLSNAYAGEFSEVDPRINASLAAVFDVVQYLLNAPLDRETLSDLRQEIADAVAQMVLLIPDMNYYFEQPVRKRISEEIDICISIVANRDLLGVSTLSREQFDGCLESLVDMADDHARRAELAGDPDGPFGMDQLRRELIMTPGQRINFALGYLHEQHPTACDPPAEPLPNPLEWSGLAAMVTWFARQSPVYFQTPENEALILGMRQQGVELMEAMVEQVDCISSAGNGVSDPVVRSLADYRQSLEALVAGLREAELEYRAYRLKPGSDVVLHGDATQQTAFRSEDLKIGPCDQKQMCEMSVELDATRALIGQFPDIYLIADQTLLGQIEICYDNIQWVNRRSEPVRADDPNVANYFGQLSFDLVGRYHENGETKNVFGSNFLSPREYHYLFAAATEEVLADSCPTEWVGSRIVTRLINDGAVRVVPDRLTYLAAARSLPSQVISNNWSSKEEWRDSFVTGLNTTRYEYETDETIFDRVNQHLQTLYQSEQSVLYSALLRPRPSGDREEDSLFFQLGELSARKALVRTYLNLFYPQSLVDSEEIRGSLEGYSSLLDEGVLRRFRQSNIAVSSINDLGIARLERFQALWNRQPEVVRRSGSVATSVAHAITRLNALYFEYFALPRSTIEQEAEFNGFDAPRG